MDPVRSVQCDPEIGVLVAPEWRKVSETKDEILKVLCSHRETGNGRIPHLGHQCPLIAKRDQCSLPIRLCTGKKNFVFRPIRGLSGSTSFAKSGRELP